MVIDSEKVYYQPPAILTVQKIDSNGVEFHLPSDFLSQYQGKQPDWGPLGYVTYKRTYARMIHDEHRTEEYWETLKRVVEGVFQIQKEWCLHYRLPWSEEKATESAKITFELLWSFKFTPPGRGLWMMGTPFVRTRGSAALNNCFSGDTEFYTPFGCVKLIDVVNEKCDVLTKNGTFSEAYVKSFGLQKLQKVILKPMQYTDQASGGFKTSFTIDFDVTKDHRWILSNGKETTNLKVGDRILVFPHKSNYNFSDTEYKMGFVHGIYFADGTRHTYYPERHIVRLCNDKKRHQELLESIDGYISTTSPETYNGDIVITILRKNENWKEVPEKKSIAYLKGFMDGWKDMDGTTFNDRSERLDTQNQKAIEWIIKYAPLVGYVITGLDIDDRNTNFGKRTYPLHRFKLTTENVEYKVQAIVDEGREEEVYCVQEPKTHSFTLSGGIITGNCGFVSTKNIATEGSIPFAWCMDMLMQGVGVGFDTKGAKTVKIKPVTYLNSVFEIPDTREGWWQAMMIVVDAFLLGERGIPVFDYSKIRPRGSPIRGFGGVASGPDPLKELLTSLQTLLSKRINSTITSVDIVDIMNFIAKCVVAGNVRRSAQIALGQPDDDEYVTCKQDQQALYDHRWASNNSTYAYVGMDYSTIVPSIIKNGEPGIFWIDNARAYSRMGYPADWKDKKIEGCNPCFVGETLIAVADGRGAVPIRQLAEEGKDVPVYSVNVDGKVEIKMARHPRITGYDQALVKVTLDDGSSFMVTPNHKMRLLNGQTVEAKDLRVDDSLPRFSKYVTKFKPNGTDYLMVRTNTLNMKKNCIAEHQLIMQFHHPEERNVLYDEDEDHDWLYDNLEKQKRAIAEGMRTPEVHQKLSEARYREIQKFYEEFEQTTDLETIWIEDRLFVKKYCETCHKPMIIPINRREMSYCSRVCMNKSPSHTASRKEGQKTYFAEKQHDVLHQQITIYKHLEHTLHRTPMKKEWEMVCKQREISFRFNPHSENEFVLKSFTDLQQRAVTYNHRVSKIESIPYRATVYNLTVDDNHTFCVVTKYNSTNGESDGIACFNCSEQTLESFELCCLCETFPSRHESYEDFERTLKYAYMYAKTVTLLNTHWAQTNNVMLKNHRIGISQSGIVDAFNKFGRREMLKWCERGYDYLQKKDKQYSEEWLCVPLSKKLTTVKPSGTISLLAGVSPGIHYPHSEYYIRRIRFSLDDPIMLELKKCGYRAYGDPWGANKKEDGSITYKMMVVEFPVHERHFGRSKFQVSMWEQLANAIDYQHSWSDNQVSITISFNKNEEKDIAYALEYVEDKLKGVSFLPLKDHQYQAPPYEEITAEQYQLMTNEITKQPDFSHIKYFQNVEAAAGEQGCSNEACVLKEETKHAKTKEEIQKELESMDRMKNAYAFAQKQIEEKKQVILQEVASGVTNCDGACDIEAPPSDSPVEKVKNLPTIGICFDLEKEKEPKKD